MQDDVKRAAVRVLNDYCFRGVWNEIQAVYRVNIKLVPARRAYQTGNAVIGSRMVPLPTADMFVVYRLAHPLFFGGVQAPRDTWQTAVTINDTIRTQLTIHDIGGVQTPLGQIWVYPMSLRRETLVAIPVHVLEKIYGNGDAQLYISIYRDADHAGRVTSQSYAIPTVDPTPTIATAQAQIATYLATNAQYLTVVVNGIIVDPRQAYSVAGGDYLDIIYDEDIVARTSVNVSTQSTGYFSLKDKMYKEILHLPKVLNPNNTVITHNSVTLYVRDNLSNRAVLLHRCDPLSVTQITHNDIAASTSVIDALRDKLGSHDVSIELLVRTHQNDNVLIEELSYLRYLYHCNDADIVRHLRGEIDQSLVFWRADRIEQTKYISLMTDTPNGVVAEQLDRYVAGLGYYTVARLLSDRITHLTVGDDGVLFYQVPLPYMLFDSPVYPSVCLNGHKLRSFDQVTSRAMSSSVLGISINQAVHRTAGMTLDIALLQGGDSRVYRVVPSLAEPTITVPFTALDVYEEVTLDTPLVGITTSTSAVYKRRQSLPGTIMQYPDGDGNVQVVFGPSLYGKTLLVQPSRFVQASSRNIDVMLQDNQPLVFVVSNGCANDVDTIYPLLSHTAIDVYVNGKELVPGIDYTATPTRDADGNLGFTEVVIAAQEMLVPGSQGNWVEIVSHTDRVMADEGGHVTHNRVSYDRSLNLWQPGLSRLVVDGLAQAEPINDAAWLTPTTEVDNGRPYRVITTLPHDTAVLLADYSDAVDNTRLQLIDRYFQRVPTPASGIVVVPASHRLYSPYLTAIINDLVTDRLVLADDPTDSRFLAQLAAYEPLRLRDPTCGPDYALDRTFVDVSPLYRELTVSVPVYNLISRLVTLILPHDSNTLGDIHNV